MLNKYENGEETLASVIRAKAAAELERRAAREAARADVFYKNDVPLARMLDLAEEFDIDTLRCTFRLVAALHGRSF